MKALQGDLLSAQAAESYHDALTAAREELARQNAAQLAAELTKLKAKGQ